MGVSCIFSANQNLLGSQPIAAVYLPQLRLPRWEAGGALLRAADPGQESSKGDTEKNRMMKQWFNMVNPRTNDSIFFSDV